MEFLSMNLGKQESFLPEGHLEAVKQSESIPLGCEREDAPVVDR
jgi:hypothetical protein